MVAQKQTLSRRQESAVRALIEHETVREAAAAARVGESSIYRWLATDTAFREALASAQERVLDMTYRLLATRSLKAFEALQRNLSCGSPSVETRAALGWLSLEHRRRATQKLETDVENLKNLFAKLEANKRA